MKKSTKISSKISQTGVDLTLENSQEISQKEIELQNKTSSEKENKIANFFKDTLDFATSGNFSIYNDNTRFKIQENQFKIFGKTQELIEKSNSPIKLISLKLKKHFIENLSIEENETLQNMWANMLANALTGKIEIEVSYIKILAELSEFDVYILDLIYKNTLNNEFCNFDILNQVLKNSQNIKLHLDGLFAKRLTESPKITGDNTISFPFPIQSNTYDLLSLTVLGKTFINSCKCDGKSEKIQDNDKISYKVDSSKVNTFDEIIKQFQNFL